jgi:hypothetical protein
MEHPPGRISGQLERGARRPGLIEIITVMASSAPRAPPEAAIQTITAASFRISIAPLLGSTYTG